MKRLIIAIISIAFLFTGCSDNEQEADTNRVPILFSLNYGMTPNVKAGSIFIDGTDKKTIPSGEKVGVFGYYHQTTNWNTWQPGKGTANVFYNEQMESTGTGDSPTQAGLTYSNLRYWPNNEGDKCSFIAYYPFTANGATTNGLSITQGTNDFTKFHFTMAQNSKDQVDFMVSDLAANIGKQAIAETVELKMHHMLCQVTVDVSKAYDMKDVTKIEFTNINVSGDCTPALTSTGMTYTWDNTTKGSAVIDNFNEPQSIILAIPHVTSGVKIAVTAKGKTDEHEVKDMKWEAGYRYKIILNNGFETVGVQVRGWSIFHTESYTTKDNQDFFIDDSKVSTETRNALQEAINAGRTPYLAIYYFTPNNQEWFQVGEIQNKAYQDIGNQLLSSNKGAHYTSNYEVATAMFIPITQQKLNYLNRADAGSNFPGRALRFASIHNIDIRDITFITSTEDIAAADAEVAGGYATKAP